MEQQYDSVNRQAMHDFLRNLPEGEEFRLRVTGNSMLPLLFNRKSQVCLVKVQSYVPKKGDVVLFFRLDGAFVLHRVHKIKKDGVIIINGDAQRWREAIHPAQVYARVIRYTRFAHRGGPEKSVDRLGYRFYTALWSRLRLIHPIGARLVHIWHRIPEKLFGKKP